MRQGSYSASVRRRKIPLSELELARQTRALRGSGATSQDNAGQGFLPAFRDTSSGKVYPSCYANGQPACVHVLEGLPPELATTHDEQGRITAVKPSVEAGFVLAGRFYSREEAARYIHQDGPAGAVR